MGHCDFIAELPGPCKAGRLIDAQRFGEGRTAMAEYCEEFAHALFDKPEHQRLR